MAKRKSPRSRRRRRVERKFDLPRYFKRGRGKSAKWFVIVPEKGTRFSHKPRSDYYDRRGVLRSIKTGYPVPRGELPVKDESFREITRRIRAHLRDATDFTWTSRYKIPRWRGWNSEYTIEPRTPGERASWFQLGEAFRQMELDVILHIACDGSNPPDTEEWLHFGFDNSIDGSENFTVNNRENRTFQPGPPTAPAGSNSMGAAFGATSELCFEWAKRYQDARIFGIVMSTRRRYGSKRKRK